MRHFDPLHASEIRQNSVIEKWKYSLKFKNMILLAKSMQKFEEETNIFVRYNGEFFKSGFR